MEFVGNISRNPRLGLPRGNEQSVLFLFRRIHRLVEKVVEEVAKIPSELIPMKDSSSFGMFRFPPANSTVITINVINETPSFTLASVCFGSGRHNMSIELNRISQSIHFSRAFFFVERHLSPLRTESVEEIIYLLLEGCDNLILLLCSINL